MRFVHYDEVEWKRGQRAGVASRVQLPVTDRMGGGLVPEYKRRHYGHPSPSEALRGREPHVGNHFGYRFEQGRRNGEAIAHQRGQTV